MARPQKPVEQFAVEVFAGTSRSKKPALVRCEWSATYRDGQVIRSEIFGNTQIILRQLKKLEKDTKEFLVTDMKGQVRPYASVEQLEADLQKIISLKPTA